MGQSRGRANPARLTLFGELELEEPETAGAAPALLHHGASMTDEPPPKDATWEEYEPVIADSLDHGYDTFEAVAHETSQGVQVVVWPMRIEPLVN